MRVSVARPSKIGFLSFSVSPSPPTPSTFVASPTSLEDYRRWILFNANIHTCFEYVPKVEVGSKKCKIRKKAQNNNERLRIKRTHTHTHLSAYIVFTIHTCECESNTRWRPAPTTAATHMQMIIFKMMASARWHGIWSHFTFQLVRPSFPHLLSNNLHLSMSYSHRRTTQPWSLRECHYNRIHGARAWKKNNAIYSSFHLIIVSIVRRTECSRIICRFVFEYKYPT